MKGILELCARRLDRPLAIAWKDLLIFGRQTTAWKGAIGALLLLGPLVAFAALAAGTPGPWRHFAPALALAVSALFSTFSFAVTVPAATSVALERDRDTLPALVVSPATPGELVLGKLLAALANALVAKAVVFPALAIAYALGGIEAGFIPRFFVVLTAADVSFASFALYASSRPLRPPRMGSPALKVGVSQAQLALQRSVGFSVLGSLLPIYASVFGLPVLLQQGLALGPILEAAGAAGAVHPLFALVCWGPVRLFGQSVPVWILATAFHLLLAVPLLAAAAEGQRSSGMERGRLPRVGLVVWFLFVVGIAAGALWDRGGDARALVPAGVGGALLLAATTGASLAGPRRRPFGRRDLLLSLVDPRRAFASAPETAPGLAFVLVLVLAPFVFAAAPAGAALRACLGLGVAALGIAGTGAWLAARAQARDAAAFERALAKRLERAAGGAAEPASGDETAAEEPASGASLVFALGILFVTMAPVLGALGLMLAEGGVPQLAAVEPVFHGLTVVGLAANPFVALLPLVSPQGTLGQILGAHVPQAVGVEPSALASFGLALWAVVALVSFATLTRAREVQLPSAPKAPGPAKVEAS